MPWPATLAAYTASVTPVDAATGSITGYLLGYGPIGIFLLALTWLLYRGWRLIPPVREDELRTHARDDARADLLKELDRVLAEKAKAEAERDDALKIAREQILPLLLTFNGTVSALLPLLQELVSRREDHDRGNGRR